MGVRVLCAGTVVNREEEQTYQRRRPEERGQGSAASDRAMANHDARGSFQGEPAESIQTRGSFVRCHRQKGTTRFDGGRRWATIMAV